MFARELSCNQVLIVEQYLAMKLFSFDRIGKALKTNMSFHAKFWYNFSVYRPVMLLKHYGQGVVQGRDG